MATYKDNVMEIKRLKTNPRMSQAVVYGGLLTTAGQVAKITAGGSVAEQAQEILSEIEALLAAAGTDKSKWLTAQIWLSDINDFSEFNTVWDAWVTPGASPTRACVESKLVVPALKVEIAVTAAVE